jgi:hypothetical protein
MVRFYVSRVPVYIRKRIVMITDYSVLISRIVQTQIKIVIHIPVYSLSMSFTEKYLRKVIDKIMTRNECKESVPCDIGRAIYG